MFTQDFFLQVLKRKLEIEIVFSFSRLLPTQHNLRYTHTQQLFYKAENQKNSQQNRG